MVVATSDIVAAYDVLSIVASNCGGSVRLVLRLREIRFGYCHWWRLCSSDDGVGRGGGDSCGGRDGDEKEER